MDVQAPRPDPKLNLNRFAQTAKVIKKKPFCTFPEGTNHSTKHQQINDMFTCALDRSKAREGDFDIWSPYWMTNEDYEHLLF